MSDLAESGTQKRSHNLDRMTLRDLTVCYLGHYTIIVNLALFTVSLAIYAIRPAPLVRSIECIAIAWMAFHTSWYLLHRFVMHSSWMFKFRFSAAVWKRIHYDHHTDPNRLERLFGRLRHTLPSLVIGTIPIGYLIGDIGGGALCFATGLLVSSYNSFLHCIQHLPFTPKSKYIQRLKRRHLLHHYHNENGNFGNGNAFWDRMCGSLYETSGARARSTTVANLGYTEDVSRSYPHVRRLSEQSR
ncbi:sterol desaturase family protein [Sphingobium subterraneum]|uniref:Sterol desaturase/sphingolipid hydroxylase (Fatty acid hydroxylase superfamily) n=1 Tax=Sphingobium subterraneum TaxID=627688 RepID=A0A841IWX9_9SPHN|nr:sterol desaturase family protein [Sphingobium subterraneum]MBB6122884.1 sterol desaturase/sphingolipid hydroxylase (fatty acid hydroxylase superfamily) [Sphingobium subterraneum]